ncbi:MAG: c-type cytochrome [Chloroflexi bacterium]|nr:c-type cytochrome [Chloroflexota bacterium]
MRRRFPLQLLLISVGIALLTAGLFFNMDTATAQTMPTPDRLAEPTLPAEPSQADKGAQVYWLACLPCHGDRGQGLTEEFKQTYPEEDRNCWNSGCHGERPYENGFTLPKTIPPVIGAGTLQKFPDAQALRSYIFVTMPFWKPGSLTDDEAWQVTAFLLRENNLWNSRDDLNGSNATLISVGIPPAAEPTPQSVQSPAERPSLALLLLVGFIALAPLFILLWAFRKK